MGGDLTTRLCLGKDKYVKANILVKEPCIVCGLEIARLVFKTKNKAIDFRPRKKEGSSAKRGEVIARIYGPARAILSAERVALNFLGLLCAIATVTRNYVDKVRPFKTKIIDTRKTFPGLRALEKYAVRTGGGYNHRFSLDEMVLIKDNHLKAIGPKVKPQWIIKEIRKKLSHPIKLEIEVGNLKEFRSALVARPDIIMLDNMEISSIKRAVKLSKGAKTRLEASGNITLKNVRNIARCGVDMISIGSLTHSVKTTDISLEIL